MGQPVEATPPLPTKRAPTHTLVIEVPLHIDEAGSFYFDPVQDAVRTILPLTRLATFGVLCGDPQLRIEET